MKQVPDLVHPFSHKHSMAGEVPGRLLSSGDPPLSSFMLVGVRERVVKYRHLRSVLMLSSLAQREET